MTSVLLSYSPDASKDPWRSDLSSPTARAPLVTAVSSSATASTHRFAIYLPFTADQIYYCTIAVIGLGPQNERGF